jgi:hypothetical protein
VFSYLSSPIRSSLALARATHISEADLLANREQVSKANALVARQVAKSSAQYPPRQCFKARQASAELRRSVGEGT